MTPFERIATLDAAYPIAFMPVRLETRFRPETRELLVRVYPDAIMTDQHEPRLTANEAAAGRDYWHRVWRDGHERDAWTLILSEVTAPRAEWIVARMTPSNLDRLGTPTPPSFPDVDVRPDQWHRAPEARGLPDRWVVTATRGERRIQVLSEPVRDGLALTLRLSGDDDEAAVIDLSGDGLTVEPALAWVYDVAEAVAAGMAVRVPLSEQDLVEGFDTLLVCGVRTTEPPEAQAEALERLLDAHRFTRGLAFVPQGASTNNTRDGSSYHPRPDPAGAASLPVARGPALATPGTDGARVASAFGIATAPLDHVWGADRDEQTRAAAMADALWPATIGYFLDQLMSPWLTPAAVDATRRWLRDWVRARGPLPAIRVGSVPYGLLPVGAVDDWTAIAAEGAPSRLVDVLKRAARLWSAAPGQPPHVGRTGDPERDLVELLAMDASTQSVKVRRSLGRDAYWNLATFAGVNLTTWEAGQRTVAQHVLSNLDMNVEASPPRAVHMTFAGRADDFAGPLVTSDPLSETAALAPDYVDALAAASPLDLKDQSAASPALLYLMLRHALLAEYDRAARRLLADRSAKLRHEDREAELVAILPTAARPTPGRVGEMRTAWDRFELRLPDVTGLATVGGYLADPQSGPPVSSPDVKEVLAAIAGHRTSLRTLAGTPTAELERLFTETLDIASHRLDAWLTSLATRRLARLREQAPRGLFLGCYGWVENLRPDPPTSVVPVTLRDGSKAIARTDSDGYVHAPSMMHGATAAVLRGAYLARPGEAYSVDLSARRVRTALSLLDAVRDSQPLGAVLGYEFERGLHEGHPGVELDRFIDAFRLLYPQVANKAQDSGDPVDTVAARTIVDGLRLLRAWQQGQIPFGVGELPAAGAQRIAIEAELGRLSSAVDALSDLLLAESVHQVVKGSPAGAAATLDTLAKGQRPPEPEVVSTPRGGTVLHQRVALLLGDGAPAPGWAAVADSPRARAARELNGWIGRVLGPPDAYACLATVDAVEHPVTLGDVGLQPIDLVLAVRGGHAEFDRRVGWFVAGVIGRDAAVAVDYETAPASALPMAAAFELAAAIGRLLGFGRALTAADLLPPHHDAPPADPMASEVEARASAAVGALTAVRDGLAAAVAGSSLGALRAELRAASDLGVAGAVPATRFGADDAALLAQAAAVGPELDRRLAAATAAGSPVDALREALGPDLPVLPRFRPAAPALLYTALGAEPDLGPDSDSAVEGWLAQLGRVRPPLDAWRDVRLYGRALGRDLRRPRIVHLPLVRAADETLPRWAALPYPSGEAPPAGLVNLALLGAPPPSAAQPWAGLLLDTWPELLPNAEEDTGLVFQFDAPRAEAPQAVLLAVPAMAAPTWSYDELERILLGTLDLARLRALDLSNLGSHGQLVPMTFLAANRRNQAVSTSFANLLTTGAVIAPVGGGQ